MKKLIYTLGIALAAGFCAQAAVPTTAQLQKAPSASKQASAINPFAFTMASSFERLTPATRADKRQVSGDDFLGFFEWSGINQLEQEVLPNSGFLYISKTDQANTYNINGMPESDINLTAVFDPATGHLVVPNQKVFYAEMYNLDAWFVNFSVYNQKYNGEDGYGFIQTDDQHQFYFRLTDEGGIQSGNYDRDKMLAHQYTDSELLDVFCAGGIIMPESVAGLGFWMATDLKGSKYNTFTYVEDEWVKLDGTATFKDAWFSVYWNNQDTPVSQVDCYYSKANPGTYMLMDPFGEDTLYGTEEVNVAYDKPGYLIFDITNFSCVVFQPLVYSITIAIPEDEAGTKFNDFATYCFNEEGMIYYLQGTSKEEIIINAFQNGNKLSTFNENTRTVTINNGIFSFEQTPLTPQNWSDGNGNPLPMTGYVILPEGWEAKVENVLGVDNAPVEYYNLQGVRLANPEKGQVVIVRQGEKVSKQIVR